MDDPNFGVTVRDPMTGQDVVLSVTESCSDLFDVAFQPSGARLQVEELGVVDWTRLRGCYCRLDASSCLTI